MLNHQVNFTRWRAADLEPEGYRPERLLYRSQVLEFLNNSIQRMERPSALNIGPLMPGLLQLMADRSGKLTSFERDSGGEVAASLRSHGNVFDAIFLWDLLLNAERDERDALVELVYQNTKMGGAIFLYSSTRQAIPARPSAFRVMGDYSIEIEPTTLLTAERHILDLKRIFPEWRCVRATQLRNGFREHLLVRER